MLKDRINIGMMGLGTVGSAVVRVVTGNRESIERKAGARLAISKVLVRDLAKPRRVSLPPGTLTQDPDDILANPGIDLVLELMGGLNPAREYIVRALESGRPVVTANKEVMATSGHDVFEAARAGGTGVHFEASVAGAIPIIGPLKQSLAANRITEIRGILNGTCNYILSRMREKSDEMGAALRAAQEMGYAEADPSDDIMGHDTARKLAILASIAFGSRVTPSHIYTEGITGVAQEDMLYGDELGWTLRLLGITRCEGGSLEARVHPAFLPRNHPLSAVHGAYNAICVVGDASGEVMFHGQGAGGLPTASSVVADVIEAVQNLRRGSTGVGCTCHRSRPVKNMEDVITRYYVRVEVEDRPGVLAQVAGVFGGESISLQSVIQKRTIDHLAEIVFVTHRAREANIRRASSQIERLPFVSALRSLIRVEA
ncbi:MAG: homoserine dehydrogenase [Bacillota bacterium]|jgi:homoserine dehydrogenase